MFRRIRLLSTEAKPVDPAYFTGNSKYYEYLMRANQLIRKHNLDFASIAEQQRWKTKHSMIHDLELRISDQSYADFTNRLNVLYPVQDSAVKEFLEQFVPVGRTLDKAPPKQLSLDEHGRSFTTASRKTAKAQVWLIPGQGQVYINGKSLSDYFTEVADRYNAVAPFEVANCLAKYNVWAIVSGGGPTGNCPLMKVNQRPYVLLFREE
jgi:small subunit ribosomal protein S9